jgi:protein-L-isoaspartate(D-aspartate) O-methyltransferase
VTGPKELANHLRQRGVRDRRLLQAFAEVDRALFVPEELKAEAYEDKPLPIGQGQTISQPYMVAVMVEALKLSGDENVLEVGGGSGYHAAILGKMAGKVTSLELRPELAELAKKNLNAAGGFANVEVICGDGMAGWPARAPYDAISVAAAAAGIPQALRDQLADGGRLVMPVGGSEEQELVLMERHGDQFERKSGGRCRFVPLL